jgi:hypothetical protein
MCVYLLNGQAGKKAYANFATYMSSKGMVGNVWKTEHHDSFLQVLI